MPTLSLVIVPAKALRDGRHKVRIAVAHNSATRYIVTNVVLDSAAQWKNGRVVKRPDAIYINNVLARQLNEVQRTIDSLPYIEGLTCAELVAAIHAVQRRRGLTLQEAFAELVETSTAAPSTLKQYQHRFNSIATIIPTGTLVSQLTPITIRRYIKARRGKIADVTLNDHLGLLAHIVNYCQRNGYTEFKRSPVEGMMVSTIAVRDNWLTPEQVAQLRDLDNPPASVAKFRDLFLLSYYLGGINFCDLCRVNFAEAGATLKYARAKTQRRAKVNPFVEFTIPKQARPIIDRYIAPSGFLRPYKRENDPRCYNALVQAAERVRTLYPAFGYITFYSARKSFAQHAFALGVSESVIDYILGHALGGGRPTSLYNYIAVTPSMATEAVEKVAAALDAIDTKNRPR